MFTGFELTSSHLVRVGEGAVPTVNTTGGAVDVRDLGFVLSHEHIMICSPEVRTVYPASYDQAVSRQRCIERLAAARAAGVGTVVDTTTIDLGRDAKFVADIAQAADMQIVMCTGLWNVPLYFQWHPQAILEEFLVGEIRQGIHGTTVKAGIIKINSRASIMTEDQQQVFRAAARAHRRTGVPITTHTDALEQSGLEQQAVLRSEGVDLSRVILGHCDLGAVDYVERLLDAGSYVSIDGFGWDHKVGFDGAVRDVTMSTSQRIQRVVSLCRAGFSSQVLISHDAAGISVFPLEWFDGVFPNSRFDYIPTAVVPALLEAGVSDADIERMTRTNAQVVLGQREAY
jgi:phosphotriesterase-related protein